MTESFVVTTPNPILVLGPDRVGQFAVTVTNVTGRQVRARFTVTPTPPMDPSWVTVRTGAAAPVPVPAGGPPAAGQSAEVLLPLGGTVQFGLDMRVPTSVPAGTYRCQPVVADVASTDEQYKLGPDLGIVVPEPPVPPKRFPFWIPIAAVALLLVAGGITWVFSRSGPATFTVPTVVGQSRAAAEQALRDAGFRPKTVVAGAPRCFPTVVSQDPVAGTVRESDAGEVRITVPPPLINAICLPPRFPRPTLVPPTI